MPSTPLSEYLFEDLEIELVRIHVHGILIALEKEGISCDMWSDINNRVTHFKFMRTGTDTECAKQLDWDKFNTVMDYWKATRRMLQSVLNHVKVI